MIAYRFRHPVIRKELPRAVCGMDALHAHDVNADRVNIPRDTRVFATSFAGYDKEKGQDDVVYLAINYTSKNKPGRLLVSQRQYLWR